jgi:hypothetical protein
MACLLAGSPIFLSPLSKNATIDGVVRLPSSLAMTTGSLPSITATQELVVPKSIPIILPIFIFLKDFNCYKYIVNLRANAEIAQFIGLMLPKKEDFM